MSSIKVHKSAPPSEPFAPMVREILRALGEDPEREGLLKTPSRVEAAYRWLTRGYHLSVADVVGDAGVASINDPLGFAGSRQVPCL